LCSTIHVIAGLSLGLRPLCRRVVSGRGQLQSLIPPVPLPWRSRRIKLYAFIGIIRDACIILLAGRSLRVGHEVDIILLQLLLHVVGDRPTRDPSHVVHLVTRDLASSSVKQSRL
jgi:hypothetical protein